MGTRGAFTAEEMVGDWIAEKKMFRAGVFPNVSATGNWEDVGQLHADYLDSHRPGRLRRSFVVGR